MTDAFDEVEEEVRRERYTRALKTYGPWAVGALVVSLAAVGGWRFYQSWNEGQARGHSVSFVAAQKDAREGEAKDAEPAFRELSEAGPAIYRELALMELAAVQLNKGDLQAALATFDQAAERASDPIVRNTARIRAAYIVADTQDFASLQARLQPMIDEGGPFSYLARELLGVEAWEAGEFDLARRTVAPLPTAFETPESVRQRAQLLLDVLGPGAENTAGNADGEASGESQAAPPAPRGEKK